MDPASSQNRRLRRSSAAILVALLTATAAPAADFYVDPTNGSSGGDGSAASPWRTLQQVIESGLVETRQWESYPYAPGLGLVVENPGAPVKAGDTIWLRTGYHGEVVIHDAYNAAPITVAAQQGHRPRLARLELPWTLPLPRTADSADPRLRFSWRS